MVLVDLDDGYRKKERKNIMTTSNRIPMIMTGQALTALRDSGFDLPTALGEPIDNSLEADANNIHIRLDEGVNSRNKKHIHRIIVADDGTGMDNDILHHYLQLGYSTRFMSKTTIGKYGVGAKLAALNYGTRIDVWSKTQSSKQWMHVYFDLEESIDHEKKGEDTGIDFPQKASIPEDLKDIFPDGKGTVVVWSKVDRLEHGRYAPDANQLRAEVVKELSRIFRYFLNNGISITVDGTPLKAHDPLMLMENSWSDFTLNKHYKKNKKDNTSKIAQKHYAANLIWEEPIKIGREVAKIRITLYPKEVIRKRGKGNDTLAKELRVPENAGRISFVRLDREVSYTNVPRIFPKGVETPDRFIGIEVAFNPSLDDYFGIRNVKRGVEPHGELRKNIKDILKKYLPQARTKLDEIWGAVAREEKQTKGEHANITEAAKEANRTMPKGRVEEAKSEEEKQQVFEDLAADVIGPEEEKKQEREEYIIRAKELPFVIESVDFPGTNFIDVQHINNSVIIRLNTRHKFYREMWEPIKSVSEQDPGTVSGADAVKIARRTVEVLSLLIIAYGKAESMHNTPHEQYDDLRNFWGQFLTTLMTKVKNVT